MDFDPLTTLPLALLGLMVAFALGWLASRFDVRQWKREQQESPKAYYKGLNLLLNEQQDKAIDALASAIKMSHQSSFSRRTRGRSMLRRDLLAA